MYVIKLIKVVYKIVKKMGLHRGEDMDSKACLKPNHVTQSEFGRLIVTAYEGVNKPL